MNFVTMAFNFAEILAYQLGNNYVKDYLVALLFFVLATTVLKVFKHIIINKLKTIVAKTKIKFDDVLIKIVDDIGWPFYLLLALCLSLQFIQIPGFIETSVYYITFIVVTYYVVRGLQTLIDYGAHKIVLKRQKEEKKVDTAVIDLLSKILKACLWVVAVILILSNLGYDVSTLIAGLGIGGIAVALALQNILTDVFSSFSIYFDKPFQIGDFIIVGDDAGVVKKVGIKTTRIQTLQGEELVISNKELTEARIHNYKKMKKRRIVFGFGVVYETSTEKLKKIPSIIKDIIDKIELADIDRVHFQKFGDFSLNFEVVYYLNSRDYNTYMDVQQEINLAIKERFEKEGIEMAYPTQTIFVNK